MTPYCEDGLFFFFAQTDGTSPQSTAGGANYLHCDGPDDFGAFRAHLVDRGVPVLGFFDAL